MPHTKTVPSLRKKTVGRSVYGVVTLRDRGQQRDVYLGAFGSAECHAAYLRTIAAWESAGRRIADLAPDGALTVRALGELYRDNHGPTVSVSQRANIAMAVAILSEHFGDCPAERFGPNKLRDLRAAMLLATKDRRAWKPAVASQMAGIIKHIFKWAVGRELLPVAVCDALYKLEPLRGLPRSNVAPAPAGDVSAVLATIREPVATMIRLQLATGMRPGEMLTLRPCDIRMDGDVWTYTPPVHKTAHRGRERRIYFGPQAQALLRPFLPSKLDGRCFANYAVASYRRAIARACLAIGVTPWHPHQLRHNYATAIRKRYGIESARILLGHADAGVTEIYAQRDHDAAQRIAQEIG